MSRTYKATGINLKSLPMGESDRLLTILTREFGLVRAVAMGSRKHNSRLGGRSGLFVVNDLLIAKGRSLDKVTQAETLESYPRLGQDLKKLTASQYLAELCLCQALSEQPQEELFALLNEHLRRLEQANPDAVLALLSHAVFQLLILAGIVPQVQHCCVTNQPLIPNSTDPNWRIGFSIPAGGTVTLAALEQLTTEQSLVKTRSPLPPSTPILKAAEARSTYPKTKPRASGLHFPITAAELALLQALIEPHPPDCQAAALPVSLWLAIEHILRQYAQYHFDRLIRSATLIDACFLPLSTPEFV
jgi:DNA repair protein RecO (recombination protein O)